MEKWLEIKDEGRKTEEKQGIQKKRRKKGKENRKMKSKGDRK